MSAAYVTSTGSVVQLDKRAEPEVVVTTDDVRDAEKLARLLQRSMGELAELRRRWNPRVLYFRDVAVTATTTTLLRFEHGFGGRVNWEIARWDASVAGAAPAIDEHSDTDTRTLVLVSSVSGTATIRVEEAG